MLTAATIIPEVPFQDGDRTWRACASAGTVSVMWPRVEGMRALELGTPGAMRDRLNGLVLNGAKRATALRVIDYADDGEEMEQTGEHLALVDDAGDRLATVEVTEVGVHRFADVPWEFAQAEGEGFADIADWRSKHSAFWDKFGEAVVADTPIACIWFRVVDSDRTDHGQLASDR